MTSSLYTLFDALYDIVWGVPFIVLIMGTSLYLTFSLKGLQFRYLWYALKLAFGKNHDIHQKGDISHFQSLMTSLAATIGIGNIAGVATCITVGGLGAIFWMWITALIGMAVKYAEAILAVKYRIQDKNKEMCGGPMYFIEYGLGWKWLAVAFAFFGCFAALGGGNMIQANSVADVLHAVFKVDPKLSAFLLASCTALTILGGIKSISKVASFLVPFMAIFYMFGAVYVLIIKYDRIIPGLLSILNNAFTGHASFGGFLGASIAYSVQVGVSRGLMTSEAGLGTASIAAAAAKTDLPAKQALVSMTGSFLATILMCTVTALVIATTDVFGMVNSEGTLINGATLTVRSFESVVSWGGYIVSIGIVLFGFTTLIGWCYYGEKCIEYLFGEKAIPFYRFFFTSFVVVGALLELRLVWKISDIFNGLMAIPNLIGVWALSSVVVQETTVFLRTLKRK